MDLNIKEMVSKMSDHDDVEDEREQMATEGLNVAAEEMMEALSSHDKIAFTSALRNFVRLARRS